MTNGKLIKLFCILLACTTCSKEENNTYYNLPEQPDATQVFDLSQNDNYGISHIDTFYIDINDNKKADTINRGRFVTGTAHGYTFYEIILDNGDKIADFRTIESADCALQAYKFQFNPFVIIKASRPLSDKGWTIETATTIEKYKLNGNRLEKFHEHNAGNICDVNELLQ